MMSWHSVPVLSVDVGMMHKIDNRDLESLHGIWTAFSKYAHTIEGGKRYENLSWRLWSQRTLCCPSKPQLPITSVNDTPPRPNSADIPELSASISLAAFIDSDNSHQDNEKCFTPCTLQKTLVNLQEQLLLAPVSPSAIAHPPTVTNVTIRPMSPLTQQNAPLKDMQLGPLSHTPRSCSTLVTSASTADSKHQGQESCATSSDSLIRSENVVYGFQPSRPSLTYRKNLELEHVMRLSMASRLPAGFSRPDTHAGSGFGRSSGDENDGDNSDDDDDDAIDFSSISEDETDWEDFTSDDGKSSSADPTLFQRVHSRPDQESRRSSLTELLEKHVLSEGQHGSGTANALERRHTAQNRIREYTGSTQWHSRTDEAKHSSWSQYIDTSSEYHQRGW